jgi:hypothetical protein
MILVRLYKRGEVPTRQSPLLFPQLPSSPTCPAVVTVLSFSFKSSSLFPQTNRKLPQHRVFDTSLVRSRKRSYALARASTSHQRCARPRDHEPCPNLRATSQKKIREVVHLILGVISALLFFSRETHKTQKWSATASKVSFC